MLKEIILLNKLRLKEVDISSEERQGHSDKVMKILRHT